MTNSFSSLFSTTEFQPEAPEFWYDQSKKLAGSGNYEEAVASVKRALATAS